MSPFGPSTDSDVNRFTFPHPRNKLENRRSTMNTSHRGIVSFLFASLVSERDRNNWIAISVISETLYRHVFSVSAPMFLPNLA